MDKLVELLNEYGEIRKYNNVGIVEWVEHTKGNLYWKYWENTWSYMVVISKEYGFIQRLVDNDKIDYDKINRNDIEININRIAKSELLLNYCKLLMLLSIQENPIEFLISVLK